MRCRSRRLSACHQFAVDQPMKSVTSWLAALGGHKLVLGMVHLQPLPGTPYFEDDSFRATLERAVESARALDEGGADGCLIQTVDRVYSVHDECDPARLTAMGILVDAVVRATRPGFRVGVQIMQNAPRHSLAVAKVAGGSFIRACAITGATLTLHGLVQSDPVGVMEYRRNINALNIKIIADIDTSHFRWLGGEKPLGEVARGARQVGADAVALAHEDERTTLEMIAGVRRAEPGLPVILAGHTSHENAPRLLSAADGAFVGKCLERGGWGGPIDADRVREYIAIARSLA